MIGATKHRGPDDEGYFCDENVSLGNARLSIIDLSERGRQPIWNEDKTICVILSGEIYNFKELRGVLEKKGHAFCSDTDTEVLVHLYEEHRERCVDFLNGIFAFAVWDKNKEELFLARDRAGVKPVYYYYDGKNFIFSSEIKAILTHPVKRRVEEKALWLYFKFFYVPGPLTLFENIYKLQPAHYLILKNGNIFSEKYWDISREQTKISEEEAAREIKSIFRDSVRRQLVADRPVGIFLSGGTDSTAVLGAASEQVSLRIKTYSVGYSGAEGDRIFEDKFNRDFYFARETSRRYGTDHHELLVSSSDIRNNFERAVWHMDEPVANPILIPTMLLADEAKKEVAVVLGGDGGDELFGGYPRYYYSRLLDLYQVLPGFLRRHLLPRIVTLLLHKSDLSYKLNVPRTIERYMLFMSQKDNILQSVLNGKFLRRTAFNPAKYLPQNKFADFAKYLMYLDFSVWLPDESLLRSDKMTMAAGLEERVPILDHRLIELAFSLPSSYKIRGKTDSKWIFRKAMAEYLPEHILKKDKRGWFPPASMWLRSGMKDFSYEVLSPSYCRDTADYLNFLPISRMLDDHINKRKYNLHMLWALLTFQVWYRRFMRG